MLLTLAVMGLAGLVGVFVGAALVVKLRRAARNDVWVELRAARAGFNDMQEHLERLNLRVTANTDARMNKKPDQIEGSHHE